MTPAAIEREESALNSQAKKVLSVTPFVAEWTISEILAELSRLGQSTDFKVVQACLSNLVDRGLVKKTGDRYQRIQARPRIRSQAVANDEMATMPACEPAAAPKDVSLLSKIATLSASLRSTANALDDIALEVEERITEAGRGSEKLRQLQQLLKGLTD